jgi:MFS family permease
LFFGAGTGLVNGFQALVAMRFFVGFGIGGLIVPFDIFAEFLPTEHRGQRLLFINCISALVALGVPIYAYHTIGMGRSWKWFVFLCEIPCLFSFVSGYFLVPESPRWLVSKGRKEEALDILRHAAAVNGKDPDEIFPPDRSIKPEPVEESGFLELFKPKWIKLTLLIWIVWFGFAFAYFGTILATTRVFEDDTDEAGQGDAAPTFNFSAIFISCTAEIVGLTFVIFTVDSYGRIKSQMLFYTLGGLCVFALCLPALVGKVGMLTFIAFCARMCEMGASCLTWVMTSEVLTTDIRTTGHSAANAVARVGGFVSPYIVEGDTDLLRAGVIILAVHVVTVFAVSCIPETKGRPLGLHETTRRVYDQDLDEILI